jgi:hypothetical protein
MIVEKKLKFLSNLMGIVRFIAENAFKNTNQKDFRKEL